MASLTPLAFAPWTELASSPTAVVIASLVEAAIAASIGRVARRALAAAFAVAPIAPTAIVAAGPAALTAALAVLALHLAALAGSLPAAAAPGTPGEVVATASATVSTAAAFLGLLVARRRALTGLGSRALPAALHASLNPLTAGGGARFGGELFVDVVIAVVIDGVARLFRVGMDIGIVVVAIGFDGSSRAAARVAIAVHVEALVDRVVAVLIHSVAGLDGSRMDVGVAIVAVARGDVPIAVVVHRFRNTEPVLADLSRVAADIGAGIVDDAPPCDAVLPGWASHVFASRRRIDALSGHAGQILRATLGAASTLFIGVDLSCDAPERKHGDQRRQHDRGACLPARGLLLMVGHGIEAPGSSLSSRARGGQASLPRKRGVLG